MEKAVASSETGSAERPLRMKIRWATRADAAALQAIYAYYVENTTVSFEYEAPSVAEMERRIAEVEGVYPFLVCVVEEEDEGALEGGERLIATSSDDARRVKRELTAASDEGEGAPLSSLETVEENEKTAALTSPTDGERSGIEKSGKGEKEAGDVGERIVGYALAHRAFERAAYSWVAETAVYVDRNWRRRGVGEALYSALIEILEAQGFRTLYAVVVAENKASVEFHKRAGYREFATFKNAGWKFGRWLDVVWLERTLGVWRDAEEGNRNAEPPRNPEEASNPAPKPTRSLAELGSGVGRGFVGEGERCFKVDEKSLR